MEEEARRSPNSLPYRICSVQLKGGEGEWQPSPQAGKGRLGLLEAWRPPIPPPGKDPTEISGRRGICICGVSPKLVNFLCSCSKHIPMKAVRILCGSFGKYLKNLEHKINPP